MANGEFFQTERFREHASRTYGRMGRTTLRRTGLEDVLRKAGERNLDALSRAMNAAEFGEFKAASTPEDIWREVKARRLGDSRTKEIVGMSLGNPNEYSDYQANMRLFECLGELCFEEGTPLRKAAGYTGSFGYGPLLERLRRANFSDPQSIHNDPEKFKDVKVYVTTGGSGAAELALGPALLTPEDTVMVHDWTYIIHLGAAYFRNAHVESYECREDGRPDSDSLKRVLSADPRRGQEIQAVVFTPIGNPVGAAMTGQDITDHLEAINNASEREGRPILAVIDVAYEAFRRDGSPLDPIKIAIEKGLPGPIAVLDTASKGYGVCGWRMGKLAIHWHEKHFPKHRSDYFKALENRVLPTLGYVPVPIQMVFYSFFKKLQDDPKCMEETVAFFRKRREMVNANLVHIAEELRRIPGVYLAKYYDHAGKNGGIEPDTLSSFYILFGFTRLGELHGSGFNQAVAFGEFALDTSGVPVINCVPGQSFLPEKRWSRHPALIRVTGLTNKEETDAFLGAVRAFAKNLG